MACPAGANIVPTYLPPCPHRYSDTDCTQQQEYLNGVVNYENFPGAHVQGTDDGDDDDDSTVIIIAVLVVVVVFVAIGGMVYSRLKPTTE